MKLHPQRWGHAGPAWRTKSFTYHMTRHHSFQRNMPFIGPALSMTITKRQGNFSTFWRETNFSTRVFVFTRNVGCNIAICLSAGIPLYSPSKITTAIFDSILKTFTAVFISRWIHETFHGWFGYVPSRDVTPIGSTGEVLKPTRQTHVSIVISDIDWIDRFRGNRWFEACTLFPYARCR